MGSPAQKVIAATAVVFISLFAGCSSSKETVSREDAAVAEMRKFEEDFRPSDYDPPVDSFFQTEDRERALQSDTVGVATEAVPTEQTQGYRVQIYASSSIDSANAHKTTAENDFPNTNFYLVYDPPTYKVRGGNFQSRFDADRFTREIAEKGYDDGWVVPDRIFKDAQPVRKPQNDLTPDPNSPHR